MLHAFQDIHVFVLRFGEVIVRTSGIALSWIFRLSLHFFDQVAPSSFRPAGYFGRVLWRLGTILWRIHGFSIDT